MIRSMADVFPAPLNHLPHQCTPSPNSRMVYPNMLREEVRFVFSPRRPFVPPVDAAKVRFVFSNQSVPPPAPKLRFVFSSRGRLLEGRFVFSNPSPAPRHPLASYEDTKTPPQNQTRMKQSAQSSIRIWVREPGMRIQYPVPHYRPAEARRARQHHPIADERASLSLPEYPRTPPAARRDLHSDSFCLHFPQFSHVRAVGSARWWHRL
jgi:hypothetical protein